MAKKRIKKLNKNFKIFFKSNKLHFETIFNFFLTIVTILIAIQNNQILKLQTLSEINEVSPSFSFNQKMNDEGYITYHLHNDKGYISNVEFIKFNNIIISSSRYEYTVEIYDNNYKTNYKKNDWYFIQEYNYDYMYNLINTITNWTEKQENLYFLVSFDSLYKISYNDFQNNYHEDYFQISDNGTSKYLSNYNNINDNFFVKRTLNIDSSKNDYKTVANYIIEYLKIYNEKNL